MDSLVLGMPLQRATGDVWLREGFATYMSLFVDGCTTKAGMRSCRVGGRVRRQCDMSLRIPGRHGGANNLANYIHVFFHSAQISRERDGTAYAARRPGG